MGHTDGTATEISELAQLPDMNPGPVLRLDHEGKVLLANAAARKLLGDGAVGGSWLSLCPGMTADRWDEVLAEADTTIEVEIGDAWFVFTHVHPSASKSVFVFGADITDRKHAEQHLAQVARFPDMNPGPVMRMDLDANVLLANTAAREVFGEDLVGRCWRDVCPVMDEARWREVLDSATPFIVEGRVGERDFLFTHRHDPLGELVFVYGSDVSEQRQVEQALRQSERMATLGTLAAGVAHELNNPAAAVRRAADQLRDAFEQLERAHLRLDEVGLNPEQRARLQELAGRARDLATRPSDLDALERSDRESAVEDWLDGYDVDEPWELAPALVAQGFDPESLEQLCDDLGEDTVPAVLGWAAAAFPVYALAHEIGHGSGRISDIVGALKDYSYLGQAPLKEIDIHEGLDNTLIILHNKLKQGVTVERDYCSDMPLVPGYGSELNQVWTNLLDNAVDAMDGKGTITIRTRRDGRWAEIEIEDTGPGIPPDALPRVFDAFFTTKEPGRGTGLGLSTSYSIVVDRHRGSIVAEPRPGGTCFIVRLPLDG